MAKTAFDFLVEAVHYSADGQIGWVRGYERRGPTFSDRIILSRADLMTRMKAGKRIMTGQRVPQMASTFDVQSPIQVERLDGEEFITSGTTQGSQDHLQGVPRI